MLFLLACERQDPAAPADSGSADSGDSLGPSWGAVVGQRVATAERDFAPRGGAFFAHNRAWGIEVELGADGALLSGPQEDIGLRFTGWGRGDDVQPAPDARPTQGECLDATLPDGACMRRIELDRGDAVEWWSNRADGVQQAWDLLDRPAGDEPLLLEVEVQGAMPQLDGERVVLAGDGGGLWVTDGLMAWDATGEPLETWFEVAGDTVRIRVDDAGAVWPITVDPVTSTAAVTWAGAALAMGMGGAVGGGGDVNGDGYDDVIIGAPAYGGSTGVAFVFYGSSTGPSTTADVTLSSPSTSAAFGTSVDIAGDVNNDGYADVIVGAPYESTAASNAGRAYVYNGSSTGLSSSVSTTLTGSGTANAYFGFAVASAGDVNKDNYKDVIIGEYGYSSSAGRVWIFAGSSSGTSTTTYQVLSGGTTGARFGYSVAGGDTNGDGYSDFAIGSPNYTPATAAGRVTHYKGSATVFTTAPTGTAISGTTGYQYGTSVALEGSFNGDAYADLFVGGPTGASTGVGRLYYYQATSSGIPAGQSGRMDGPGGTSYYSARIAYVGDVNGDGYSDLLVGAPYYNTDAGYVALYEGKSTGFGTSTAVASVSWTGSSTEYLGAAVGAAGDVNADGYDDLLIGSPGAGLTAGRATLHYGGVDADGDGYLYNGSNYQVDCDDSSSSVNPGATEVCDASNTDEDCDGSADESGASGESTFYADDDGDGYGDATSGLTACDAPTGYVATSTDCDDGDMAVSPAASEVCDGVDNDCDGDTDESGAGGGSTYYADADGDGYGDPLISTTGCAAPTGYVSNDDDCDDTSAGINPGATEVCDASDTDEDCDGSSDESGASGESTWYADDDGDGYGDASDATMACDLPTGHVSNDEDCDDASSTVHPGATEVCDASNTDEDCDGSSDESGASGESTFYADDDGDGYGDASSSAMACDAPAGHVSNDDDCDDGASSVHPGATEVCDASNDDEDCDGLADDNDSGASGRTPHYTDADRDGYGDPSISVMMCDDSVGFVSNDDDCDDSSSSINPGATETCDASNTDEDCDGSSDESGASGESTWYADDDGDSYGDPSSSMDACDQPSGHVSNDDDCDDGSSSVHPGATEVCDTSNTDEDCDGVAEESGASGETTWYVDADVDFYGDPSSSVLACDTPTGHYATNDDDCDDTDPGVNPGMLETCDGEDDDCDGATDESGAAGETSWYADADSDSYGDPTDSTVACDQPSGYTSNDEDCDDTDSGVNPGATEICDPDDVDEDCDGSADDRTASGRSTWYADSDEDGYGGTVTSVSCDAPAGYVSNNDDCDDDAASVHPGATELCDSADTDEDCDGSADEAGASGESTWYADGDADGYGDADSADLACDEPTGFVSNDDDCDDADADVNPGATEICDASDTDEDCDGAADDASATGQSTWYSDGDGDGYGDPSAAVSACDRPSGAVANADDCDDTDADIHPGATEICDAADTDEDCDGSSEETGASGERTWYADLDGDGYGDASADSLACDQPSGSVSNDDDCDDADADDHPGATEIVANGDDESCDGLETCYADSDDDGYLTGAGATVSSADADCDDVGEALDGEPDGDCDDGDAAYNPGATEDDCTDPNDYNCDGAVGYTDADADGWAACAECDDADASVYPGATEVPGDAVDGDCDGGEICYGDGDGDGYLDGSGDTVTSADADCADDGEAADGAPEGDCDDDDAALNPGAVETCDGVDNDCDGAADDGVEFTTWYTDADSDGYGDPSSAELRCDVPTGAVTVTGDCDDADADINPGQPEICDAADADEDCDGLSDDASAAGQSSWYHDSDGDGYGDADVASTACDAPADHVSNDNDCDDADEDDYPGATEEIGNGDDEDCDGAETCYTDDDADGYRADDGPTAASADADCDDLGEALEGTPVGDCDDADAAYNPGATEDDCADPNDYNCDGSTGYDDNDADGWAACEECDDADADVYPGAAETAGDGLDSDCDGGELCYVDADDDGYTAGSGDTVGSSDADCVDSGEAEDTDPDGDCDDADGALSPGAVEVCDGVDNDCDGTVDDGVEAGTWYTDGDGDGYGDDSTAVSACERPDGAVAVGGDCDDTRTSVHPGGYEICDDEDLDEDCDGSADGADALGQSTWYADADGDGYGDPAGTTEACDAPVGYAGNADDCDDADSGDYLGADETVGNGDDEDCDGQELCLTDEDDDGYALDDTTSTTSSDADCDDLGEALLGEPTGDCDDDDEDYNPGAIEADCSDPNDYNCDGSVGYDDLDEDGWAACQECNDADADINPDAVELAGDAVDSDCDGAELCYEDGDDDGYVDGLGETVDSDDVDCVDAFEASEDDPDGDCDDDDATSHPGAADIPDDGVDQDCDGEDATTGGDDSGPDDSGPDDSGPDDSGPDDSGPDDSAADDTSDPFPDGDDTADSAPLDSGGDKGDGCGCASAPAPSGLAGLVLGLFALLGLRRRR